MLNNIQKYKITDDEGKAIYGIKEGYNHFDTLVQGSLKKPVTVFRYDNLIGFIYTTWPSTHKYVFTETTELTDNKEILDLLMFKAGQFLEELGSVAIES